MNAAPKRPIIMADDAGYAAFRCQEGRNFARDAGQGQKQSGRLPERRRAAVLWVAAEPREKAGRTTARTGTKTSNENPKTMRQERMNWGWRRLSVLPW